MGNLVEYKNFLGLPPGKTTAPVPTGSVIAGLGGLACAGALYYFLVRNKKWLWVGLLGASQLMGMIARSSYPTNGK